MKGLDPDRIVTLKTNDGKFNSRSVSGVGDVEIIDPTSMAMLKAAKEATMAAFVAAHPTWVAAG